MVYNITLESQGANIELSSPQYNVELSQNKYDIHLVSQASDISLETNQYSIELSTVGTPVTLTIDRLNDITDVFISNLQDEQYLRYNATSEKWENISLTTDIIPEGDNNLYDQTVILNAGSNVTITGTYPEFTISSIGGGGGSSTFIELEDTPVSYAGQQGKAVIVNNGEDGLIFADVVMNVTWDDITGTQSNINVSGFTVDIDTDDIPEGLTRFYDKTVVLTSGTGISTTGTYPSFTITNTAPDQTVTFSGGTNVTIGGTYPSFVITDNSINTTDLSTALEDYIPLTQKAANNGVATLDAGGKVPANQLPSTVMNFLGVWNASTNTPTLSDGVGSAGDVYNVSVAGTQNLGSGNITFALGDWVIYNGTIWEKSDNSDDVVSVNGQQGVVVLGADDLTDVTISSGNDGDFLQLESGNWINTNNPTFNELTTNRMVYVDGTNKLQSVSNLATWIAGTSNQVIVANDGDGSITLSTPQSIAAASTPTFNQVILSSSASLSEHAIRKNEFDAFEQNLSNIATSGSFNDLSDVPNIVNTINTLDGDITLSAGVGISFSTTGNTITMTATGSAGGDVPIGGTTGQVLAKASGTDYDTEWVDQSGGGSGLVDSVFGRTGDVVAATNDYTWAQIDKSTSDIADFTNRSHINLTDIGTNTHAQIDTHISSTTNPHSVTASQVSAVGLTGNESIDGIKTFTSFPILPNTNPVADYQATHKKYVDDLISIGISWKDPVIEINKNDPPASPSTGDRYTIGNSPTGAWASNEDDIAEWNGSAWDFTTAVAGDAVLSLSDELGYTYNGTTWVAFSSVGVLTGSNGINVVAQDAQLGGTLTSQTTIDFSSNDLIFNLSSSGSFIVQDASSDVFSIEDNGYARFGGFAGNNSSVFGQVGIQTISASDRGLVIRGQTGQSSDLLSIQSSTGSNLFNIDENGKLESNLSNVNNNVNHARFIQSPIIFQQNSNTGTFHNITTTYTAVKFTANDNYTSNSLFAYLKRTGDFTNPRATLSLRLYSDNAGQPGTLLNSGQNTLIGAVSSATNGGKVSVGNIVYSLTSGTTYWIVMILSQVPAGATLQWLGGTSGTDEFATSSNGSTWTTASNISPRWGIEGKTGVGNFISTVDGNGAIINSVHRDGLRVTTELGSAGVFTSNTGRGLLVTSNYGDALIGSTISGIGIFATTQTGTGLRASTTSGTGALIISQSGNGLIATTNTGLGAQITSSAGRGLEVSSGSGLPVNILSTFASTDDIETIIDIKRSSSGTPSSGIGAQFAFSIQNNANQTQARARMGFRLDDATDGSEDVGFFINMQEAGGSITEKLKLESDGTLEVSSLILSNKTANTLSYFDANKELQSVTINSPITFSTGTLDFAYDINQDVSTTSNVTFNNGTFDGTLSVSGNNRLGIGTSSPSRQLVFTDNGLGFERITTNTLGIYTNNTERMRIDSAGRVGIGKTPSGAALDVEHSTSFGVTGIKLYTSSTQLTSSDVIGIDVDTNWDTDTNNLYGVRSRPTGVVLALGAPTNVYALYGAATGGTTSNWAGYFESGNVNIENNLIIGGSSSSSPTRQLTFTDNGLGFERVTTNTLGIFTNNTERMRIDSNGNVGINTTTASTIKLRVTPTSSYGLFIDNGASIGAIYARATTAINAVAYFQQSNSSGPFIRFQGSLSTTNDTESITTAGAGGVDTSVSTGPDYNNWSHTGMIKINVNGSLKHIPYYDIV